jgi:predicted NUDIX family phosphoesterase/deoxycytidine triphosphate deaminase
LKVGFTYLLPLREKLLIQKGEYVKSSPKSSFGRLFLNTRLLADYHHSFDQIITQNNKAIDLWLLVQPLAFNIIAHPNIAFNQLRFFKGYDSKLSTKETIKEFQKNPLLYIKQNGVLIPAVPTFAANEGLQLHLDIAGENNKGIAGLRARKNPNPIDTNNKRYYQAEEYFEPQRTKDLEKLSPGKYYLIASREVLKIPSHLSSELRTNSYLGLSGPLHFAGFIDPGFTGDLVFEIRSDEISNSMLTHEMPISTLDIFRISRATEKQYGVEIGSTYNNQTGPRPSKFFKEFDYSLAAKDYKKLDRMVLVQDAKLIRQFRNIKEGFEIISNNKIPRLDDLVRQGMFHSRYDCEQDEEVIQPIPYLVIFGPDKTVFTYIRAENIQDFGETRLFGKTSIGVGGHIVQGDYPNYIKSALTREQHEEVTIIGTTTEPKIAGTLLCSEQPVDRVHFGLVYITKTTGTVQLKESSLLKGELFSFVELQQELQRELKIIAEKGTEKGMIETWTRKLIPHLDKLYNMI